MSTRLFPRSGALAFKATSIAQDPKSRRMVVSSAVFDKKQQAAAATVEIDATGKLVLVAKSSLPTPTGYTSVDRSGQYFLSVNYATGDVAVYRFNDDAR